MERFFQISFFTGALFTIASFALGSIFGSEDADVDLDTDTEFDVDADVLESTGAFSVSRVVALKPSTLSAFATVFGGVGMIALGKGLSIPGAVAWGAFLGVLAMLFLTHALINPLKRAQNTGAISQTELIGRAAVVQLDMDAERFGQISYSVNNSRFSAPAKSSAGTLITKGATVTVVSIVDGVFFVDIIKEDEKCQEAQTQVS